MTKRTLTKALSLLVTFIAIIVLYQLENNNAPISFPIPTSTHRLTTSTIFQPTTTLQIPVPLGKEQSEWVMVTRIIDGDTIEFETGEKVRYIGINTPESVDPRRAVQCFGKEAAAYNALLVLNKYVRLEKDVSDKDRYGRLLRYVYVEDGTFINLKLIQDGYAQAATFPPDVKYSKVFVEAAQEAREQKKGLWGSCQ